MRNPLNKRLPRELKSELIKYIILFLFLVTIIGFISGFLVASGSLRIAYNESFEKYNIEDGNFEYYTKADENTIDTIEEEGVKIYENFYIEKETKNVDSTLRIYQNREEVDKVYLMEGAFPQTKDEIAIDRMYADNNHLKVGDTISFEDRELTITGLVAFSDYCSLFSSTSDMMFDAFKFGVAVVTEEGFDSLGEAGIHYSYSWLYDKAPEDEMEEKELSEAFLKELSKHGILTNFVPQYLNPSIKFADDDMGNDRIMFMVFLYIVIAIIAFIFAVTTSNVILKEATVIGTLRASGYTKGEIIRHYMAMPVLVTLISALVGNILGYTLFLKVAVHIYYTNYSLPTFVAVWNADAFIKTTVIPVILMIVINYVIISNKMNLSPMQFLRRNLSKKQKKKAFRLNTKIGIMKRFRLRVIFQNVPNYVTLVIGIFLANVIMILGIAFPALLENYQQIISDSVICKYQYILKTEVETKTEGAEKYCAGSLMTMGGNLKSESVSLFGMDTDSAYLSLDLDNDNIYISSSFSDKYDISEGETITLKEEYGDKEYQFKVTGIHDYSAGIAVFMSREYFNEIFGYEEGYFNGYLSDKEIEDINELFIATVITEDDLNKMSRQMGTSMGGVFEMFFWFGLVMFMLIIYLLSKLVIEKNTQSISMTKILGYTNKEISGLYIMATSLVVIISFIVTMPIVNELMRIVCAVMLSEYPGWIPYYIPSSAFIKIIIAGIASYAVIVFMQFRKVKKIPLDIALKNVE
ncbi:MAG: ABC transporter permease [Lachnospiraceae bacterium]|nr:ABC transporter permease [Lachnospiraceae bacterium]